MYDQYVKSIIDTLPTLPGLDKDECRRILSRAYLSILRTKMNAAQTEDNKLEASLTGNYLRRLTDTLQSIAIYDRLNGVEVPVHVQTACAFVAAESLSLLYELQINEQEPEEVELITDVVVFQSNYCAIEAALLYMIGGYDINAASIANIIAIPPETDQLTGYSEIKRVYSESLVSLIKALCMGELHDASLTGIEIPPFNKTELISKHGLLHEEIRIQFYKKLGQAVLSYINWLKGEDDQGLTNAQSILQRVIRSTMIKHEGKFSNYYSDIYHLGTLLISMIECTQHRSVVHTVPEPTGIDLSYKVNFQTYLRQRASGNAHKKGRPFLWPSTSDYIIDCLQTPYRDAVISMPTGSGKSFIAEIAISHALHQGWVLYIAPTNSLAHQIRRDLSSSLSAFSNVTIKAFIGGAEYTSLEIAEISDNTEKFVAVMTPEKCALALRLYPEQFKNCRLCIFDECHLLNDSNRGLTADIMLAQLLRESENIRFLLMSAMISNANELADWLKKINDKEALPKTITWRPSRTLRGLLLVDRDSLRNNLISATEELNKLPENRVNFEFQTPLALIAGLSGPWTFDGERDYKVTRIPVEFTAKVRRREANAVFESWKNTASRNLSELLASSGIPVINFILTSRHHAFSSAGKVNATINNMDRNDIPTTVSALLKLADRELGVETVLWDLFCRGVSVHSSAMLHVEQTAAEIMFSEQKTKLMFATGTLAQGLNLPAIAVVIAGTSMGDPRETDNIEGVTRANALIANAFGRASRPGFSNQGVAILVSNETLYTSIANVDPAPVLRQYGVLGEPDALVEVRSPIEKFIDNVLSNDTLGMSISSDTELTLTSLLAEYNDDDNHSGHILSRTFGAYKSRLEINDQNIEKIRLTINKIKQEFLEQPEVPDWMNTVAMKSGVDFFRAWSFWRAYESYGVVDQAYAQEMDVTDWLDVFFNVLAKVPPYFINDYLPDATLVTPTVFKRMRDAINPILHVTEFPWDAPENWGNLIGEFKELVLCYMRGESYSEIAKQLLNIGTGRISNSRSSGASPIPAVFKFIRQIIDKLSIDAGCFLAINEIAIYRVEAPESLKALPLCIKNGCNTLEVLCWYRTIIRHRTTAHFLNNQYAIPENDFANDEERATWIKERWLEFLREDIGVDDFRDSVRIVTASYRNNL